MVGQKIFIGYNLSDSEIRSEAEALGLLPSREGFVGEKGFFIVDCEDVKLEDGRRSDEAQEDYLIQIED